MGSQFHTPIGDYFLSLLAELRSRVLERLLTTPLEILERKEYLNDVESHNDELQSHETRLEAELTQTARDAEREV